MDRRLWIRVPRSLLGGSFFVLYGIGSLVIGGLLFPPLLLCGARMLMSRLVRASWKLFVWGGRWTGLFRVDISPEDRAKLASTRGRVIVANHLTLIDIVVLTVFLPDATAIAKAAAKGNFFYSLIVKGMFLVNDDPLRVMDEAGTLLGQGVDLVVFPQGTRVPAGTPKCPLRRGAAQIALHAGAPVLPVSITCSPPVLAKGQPWYQVGDRVVVYTLKAGDEISVVRAEGSGTHAAAVALTKQIGVALDI